MFHKLEQSASDVENLTFPGDGEHRKGPWRWPHYLMILVFLFPYVCIIVLFVLVSNVDNSTKNYYQGAAVSTFTAKTSVEGGKVVSFAADGSIQSGAGTSIYGNIVDITMSCPMFLSMDSVYSNAYVVSYADKTSKTASIQVISVSSANPDEGTVESTTNVNYYLYEITTLSAADGIFVGISQDADENADAAFVVAGKVNKNTYEIGTFTKSAQYGSQYSMTPTITRLSDTTFAMAYYSSSPTQLTTRYGKVDPSTLEITLFDEVYYEDDQSNLFYFNMVGMTDSSYLLVYYNTTTKIDPYFGYGPLQAKLATVATATGAITLSEPVVLADSNPIYALAAARLDDDTAVVAYADYDLNSAMRVQSINVNADNTIEFTSYWAVTSGQAAAVVSGGMMDLDVVTVSDDNRFMVLFSDVSNKGALTASMGQVTTSGEIVRASPDFVLNTGSTDAANVYSWAALAAGSTTTLASRTAILSSVTAADCTKPATSFSMMEIKPAPLGVTPPSKSTITTSKVDVCFSGTLGGWSALAQGYSYYGNTMGGIIQGDTLYGRGEGSGFSYMYDADTDTYVTSDSKIGFAPTTDSVYVHVQA